VAELRLRRLFFVTRVNQKRGEALSFTVDA
jgi:hypothetical protein